MINMRKLLNIAIAFMLLFAPLVQTNQLDEIPSHLVNFGAEVDDDCENETKEEDLPYYVDKDSGSDDNVGS